MMNRQEILLQALHSALEWRGTGVLEPDRVTGLGAVLGLRPDETVEMAQRLRADGLIDFQWGGMVALTEKGRDRASGGSRAASIHLGNGAILVEAGVQISNSAVGPGAISGSAIGQGAMAQGATRIDVHLGELTVALSELRRMQTGLSPQAADEVQRLENEVRSVVDEVQRPGPDNSELAKHLDRTRRILEKLAGISEAGEKLGPTLKLITRALGMVGLVPGL